MRSLNKEKTIDGFNLTIFGAFYLKSDSRYILLFIIFTYCYSNTSLVREKEKNRNAFDVAVKTQKFQKNLKHIVFNVIVFCVCVPIQLLLHYGNSRIKQNIFFF